MICPVFRSNLSNARGEKPTQKIPFRICVNCGDPARGEAIRVTGAMHISAELLLLEIENINSSLLSSHPQNAAPVLIDRYNSVIAEAIRVALIVLEEAR